MLRFFIWLIIGMTLSMLLAIAASMWTSVHSAPWNSIRSISISSGAFLNDLTEAPTTISEGDFAWGKEIERIARTHATLHDHPAPRHLHVSEDVSRTAKFTHTIARYVTHVTAHIGAPITVQTFDAGLPFRCARAIWTIEDPRWHGDLRAYLPPAWLPPVAVSNAPNYSIDPWVGQLPIPISPLWGGLICNGLVFACLMLLPRLLMQLIRSRKNGCTKCGYPRAGLTADAPCPECGTQPAIQST
jgi:hypothetical protein